WRDAGDSSSSRINVSFNAEGYAPADGEEPPLARLRIVSPGLFSVLGMQVIAGRDFNDADRRGAEPVAIVNQTLAQRYFPNGDAVNRHLLTTDTPPKNIGRIVGVVADVDDEHLSGQGAQPAVTFYRSVQQSGFAGRLFLRSSRDPH